VTDSQSGTVTDRTQKSYILLGSGDAFYFQLYYIYFVYHVCDLTVVGFITPYVISAYHQ
jgi:hypothetical protein